MSGVRYDRASGEWREVCPREGCDHVVSSYSPSDIERRMETHLREAHGPKEAVALDLHGVVAKAQGLFADQKEELGLESSWDDLQDWQQLSWYMEAADQLGMEL